MSNLDEIANALSSLTILEICDLVKNLEEKWGVSASVPVMAQVPQAQSQNAPEEKSSFDVVLSDPGASKINVIKEVRAITGLGLAEAKALVDGAPKVVKESVKKEEAEEMKKKLEAAGAKIDLK